MKLGSLRVTNYRALRDVSTTLSNFSCLIGENNAGKSSVLQALILLHSGTSLLAHNYFDPTQDICIQLSLDEITEEDLNRLHLDHRDRIRQIIRHNQLKLVRRYSTDGKSRLRYYAKVPNEARFSETEIDTLMFGGRPGAAFAQRITTAFPELAAQITAQTNQGQARAAIAAFAATLPDEQLVNVERDLPTGFDKSVTAFLPEPIYVPAVKDFSDDIKTKESTPLGRILAILLEQIEGQLADATNWFSTLNQRLNRTMDAAGNVVDGRLPQVQEIETLVENYVTETFATVKLRLEIPPPEIKAILAGTRIYADDGVDGLLETKGDGLRRAVIFAILRSYVEMRRRQAEQLATAAQTTPTTAPPPPLVGRYLLLFEEPELYLHPSAQKVLFDALAGFASDHLVVVTTHSPLFFGPEATTTFIKVRKKKNDTATKPYTELHPISLTGVTEKDQFQIICYENNHAAFFGDVIVLVEGPSDYLTLPHIAKTLNPDWRASRNSVRFARIGGKSSIRKYRDFFRRFGARVAVISDLDILINDFDQADPTPAIVALRSELLVDTDTIIAAQPAQPEMNAGQAAQAQQRGTLKAIWRRAKAEYHAAVADGSALDTTLATLDEFFAFERKDQRLDVLANETQPAFLAKKRDLLRQLRERDVFILERGAIEAYYPPEIPAGDKPSRAQHFCNTITNRTTMLSCCAEIIEGPDTVPCSEFELIFRPIFRSGGG